MLQVLELVGIMAALCVVGGAMIWMIMAAANWHGWRK